MCTTNILQVKRSAIQQAYEKGDASTKQTLVNLFGDYLIRPVMEVVKTFEDACKLTGIDSSDNKFFYGSPDTIAYEKLKVIIGALNEGWMPDWNNSKECKYYPWFELKGGFRLRHVADYYSSSSVGSRLCFKNADLAKYAVSQFESLYKAFFLS